MSQIPTSNIAASVAQGALQQSQVARVRDARSNQGVRQAQQLRESAAKHVEQVEDPFEASDEHMKVGEDSGGRTFYEQPERDGEREEIAEVVREAGAAKEAEGAYKDERDGEDGSHHVDLTA